MWATPCMGDRVTNWGMLADWIDHVCLVSLEHSARTPCYWSTEAKLIQYRGWACSVSIMTLPARSLITSELLFITSFITFLACTLVGCNALCFFLFSRNMYVFPAGPVFFSLRIQSFQLTHLILCTPLELTITDAYDDIDSTTATAFRTGSEF